MKNNYNIVGKRKIFFILSACLIAFVLLYSVIFGVSMDIQFKGGAMITYSYTGEVNTGAVASTVNDILKANATIQTGSDFGTGTQTLTVSLSGVNTITTEEVAALETALNSEFSENAFEQLSMKNVNPTIGSEFLAKCLVAVLAAAVLILIYIAFRFRKIGGMPAGCMAVVALVHDLLIVFGVFVVFRIPLNGNFIAAMLTILGYSINDTVVIYDRIRENRSLLGNTVSFESLVNTSINQSLRRSINTTISTVIALGSVCVFAIAFGLNDIFTFALTLIIGMISGVYSTICIAGPLWVEWENRKLRKAPGSKKS